MDATHLSYAEGAFGSSGRYKDSDFNANVNYGGSPWYDTNDDTNNYSDQSIFSASSNFDFSSDHVLTVKGHIVLENDKSVVSTINSVAFDSKGNIHTDGILEAKEMTAHSDARLKKNVQNIQKNQDIFI